MPNRRPYNLNGLNLGWWLSLPSRNQKIDDICTCMSKIRLMIYIYIIHVYLHGHIIRCACFRSIPQHPPTFKHWTSSRLSTTWHTPTWFVIFLNSRRRSGRRIWDKQIYRFRFLRHLRGFCGWMTSHQVQSQRGNKGNGFAESWRFRETIYTLNNVCLDCSSSKSCRRQGQSKIHDTLRFLHNIDIS